MTEPKPRYDAGEAKAVEIRAELRQVRTMADHTINVIFNIPEDCLPQAKVLLGWIGNEVKAVIENIPGNR
jgi:hypothetical protein